MDKRIMFVLTVLILTMIPISSALADESVIVSYTASRHVPYDGPIGMIDFDVNVTVEYEVTYDFSVDGDLPTSTCHLQATPNSGTLTLDYHIDRPIGKDLDGSKSIPMSGENLLGDSEPIAIPVGGDIGNVTIIIHAHLFANLNPDTGSATPNSLEWSTWGTQDTVISADTETVLLTMETEYKVFFTVTVSIHGFDVASRDSTIKGFPGTPSAEFLIPEFPNWIAYIIVIGVTSSVVLFKKLHRTNRAKKRL